MTQGGDAHCGAVTALAPALVLDLGAAVILSCRAGGRAEGAPCQYKGVLEYLSRYGIC